MKELVISDNFTVEDIHLVREYNYAKRKKMSLEERLADIKNKADECEKDIDKFRKSRIAM